MVFRSPSLPHAPALPELLLQRNPLSLTRLAQRPDNGGSKHLKNVGQFPLNDAMQIPEDKVIFTADSVCGTVIANV
jgi:hypothetical protein